MNFDKRKELEHFLTQNAELFDIGDRRSAEFMKTVLDNLHRKHSTIIPKETVPYDIGLESYKYILENGGSSKEALEYAVLIHDKTFEWLEEVKHRPYYHSKAVVKACEDHPNQKIMLENGTMDKSSLKSSRTISQQMNRLSKSKKVSDTLEELKKNDAIQQEKIDTLEASSNVYREQITHLQEITGIEKMSDKEIARILFDKGCTQKATSDFTGKHISTIKRWWKEFKDSVSK